MAKLVKTDGTVVDVLPENGVCFSLKEMQKAVGGYIQFLPSNSELFVLCVNEDGKAIGLSMNKTATSMASEIGMALSDYIVGDILIGTATELGYSDED